MKSFFILLALFIGFLFMAIAEDNYQKQKIEQKKREQEIRKCFRERLREQILRKRTKKLYQYHDANIKQGKILQDVK